MEIINRFRWIGAIVALLLTLCPALRADVITDWNTRAGQVVVDAAIGPGPANIVMAVVQTAVYEAVNAITGKYQETLVSIPPARDASIEAAVAAANHAVLVKLVPSSRKSIDSLYEIAIRSVQEGPAKSAGIATGEKAAAAVLALRKEDLVPHADSYRPFTVPAQYVPTVIPAGTQHPKRKPWMMTNPAQFRPGPPPSLTGEVWSRDYNEIKAIGSKNSNTRTAGQTEIARFWEETMPPIYCGIVCSIALMPDRDVSRNARLYATVAEAIDDALIAVMDAKYHYNFWRPITAIRNGDLDSNSTTEQDLSWTPFIPTPLHPEYPCAHCIVSGTVATILNADLGNTPCPTLTTTSAAAGGVTRSWTSIDDFLSEVANARIYDGVHFRNSTEVGTAMGRKIGELAIARFGKSPSEASPK